MLYLFYLFDAVLIDVGAAIAAFIVMCLLLSLLMTLLLLLSLLLKESYEDPVVAQAGPPELPPGPFETMCCHDLKSKTKTLWFSDLETVKDVTFSYSFQPSLR